jgi:hypothetical protein
MIVIDKFKITTADESLSDDVNNLYKWLYIKDHKIMYHNKVKLTNQYNQMNNIDTGMINEDYSTDNAMGNYSTSLIIESDLQFIFNYIMIIQVSCGDQLTSAIYNITKLSFKPDNNEPYWIGLNKILPMSNLICDTNYPIIITWHPDHDTQLYLSMINDNRWRENSGIYITVDSTLIKLIDIKEIKEIMKINY